ncbi:hypothetical protein [Polyangium fumosum]|uniref:Outer membrane protein beta-barrel domain-containing protein n=1 Tax=Polyangium fumosum TaxID=889272 RepID=A0A4U1JDG6_9BACT|nr:hypothetical protein [Polyangium fumosum]TKD07592.1 hypothetical protein E8A74_17665 [Polyangium fumosum]
MPPSKPGAPVVKPRPRLYRVGATVGYAWTNLVFAGKYDVAIDRRAAVATFERRLGSAWTLQLGAGGILWGSLREGARRYDFGPGWSASVATSYRLLDGRDRFPFLILGASLAVAGAQTREARPDAPVVPYYAGDLRLSAVAGKTFYDVLSPYALARVFGGPIFWQVDGVDRQGTDRYKFQLGLGLVASLPIGLDVFAEIVPLGERSVTSGAGFSF